MASIAGKLIIRNIFVLTDFKSNKTDSGFHPSRLPGNETLSVSEVIGSL